MNSAARCAGSSGIQAAHCERTLIHLLRLGHEYSIVWQLLPLKSWIFIYPPAQKVISMKCASMRGTSFVCWRCSTFQTALHKRIWCLINYCVCLKSDTIALETMQWQRPVMCLMKRDHHFKLGLGNITGDESRTKLICSIQLYTTKQTFADLWTIYLDQQNWWLYLAKRYQCGHIKTNPMCSSLISYYNIKVNTARFDWSEYKS